MKTRKLNPEANEDTNCCSELIKTFDFKVHTDEKDDLARNLEAIFSADGIR